MSVEYVQQMDGCCMENALAQHVTTRSTHVSCALTARPACPQGTRRPSHWCWIHQQRWLRPGRIQRCYSNSWLYNQRRQRRRWWASWR